MARPRNAPEKKPKPTTVPESVVDRTLWQSYTALPAGTRLKLSVAMATFAVAGIVVSNYLEKAIPIEHPASKDE